MVSLVAEGLGFRYSPTIPALDGVDLALEPGQLLVVCGPNGSGKSTLLKLLAGLLEPERGAVHYDGRGLDAMSLRERARTVARVPQELTVLPDTGVREFVLAGRYARIERWAGPTSGDWQAVDWSLAAADAEVLAERAMAELSGGQRRRVLLARALAQEAQVLLVDEPTNALDPAHQLSVFDMIAELGRHGRGVLVVSHDLGLAGQYATDIALMDAGRIVHRGPPADVLRPEVLTPVYGERLHYAELPDGRRLVVPLRG